MSDYTYDAVVKSVHDGDTITVDMDLGLDMTLRNFKIRLFGINCPELVTPEGKKAQAFLAQIIPVGTAIVVETVKDKQEKYGRYLGKLYKAVQGSPTLKLPVIRQDGTVSLNELLVENGFAKPYFGVGQKPT